MPPTFCASRFFHFILVHLPHDLSLLSAPRGKQGKQDPPVSRLCLDLGGQGEVRPNAGVACSASARWLLCWVRSPLRTRLVHMTGGGDDAVEGREVSASLPLPHLQQEHTSASDLPWAVACCWRTPCTRAQRRRKDRSLSTTILPSSSSSISKTQQ